MKRRMEIKDLNGILSSHKLWIDSRGEEGQGADLRGADLSGAYLYGADLREGDLREANLQAVNFYKTNLRGAKFTIEIRDVFYFEEAQVSENQLPWLVLHPRFGDWMAGLEIE